jgi:hypothetical protein
VRLKTKADFPQDALSFAQGIFDALRVEQETSCEQPPLPPQVKFLGRWRG